MGVIPVVHRSATLRATIRRGLPRRGFRVVGCRSLDAVRKRLERDLVEAVVVDVRTEELADAAQLVGSYPRIPVFALCPFRPDDAPLLVACRRAGLAVLVEGVDDPAAGELILPRTTSMGRRAQLADAPRLLRLTEPLQLRAWDEVLVRAGRPTTTQDIARALRRTREHVSREFAAGGAPNLKRVIDLARAACAADLLGNPGYRVGTVAGILGFSSGSHLSESTRRVAGVCPAELGRLGPRGLLQRFARGRTRSRL